MYMLIFIILLKIYRAGVTQTRSSSEWLPLSTSEGVDDILTLGEGVRLDNVEESMDHVEEDPYGPRFIVGVRVINCRRHEAEVQRLHRRRRALPAGVRADLGWGGRPLVRRLLLAAGGPPAEEQDDPACPQHGSHKSSFTQKLIR